MEAYQHQTSFVGKCINAIWLLSAYMSSQKWIVQLQLQESDFWLTVKTVDFSVNAYGLSFPPAWMGGPSITLAWFPDHMGMRLGIASQEAWV